MGLGEHKPEDFNKEIEECLSPFTNEDTEKAAIFDNQGTWKKLRYKKVPLIPVLVILVLLILAIVAAAVLRSEETPTTGKEKCVYKYAECMEDWIHYKDKCYYLSKDIDTWNNSQNFCQFYNSSLVIIDSEKELGVLNHYRCDVNYWIGLSRVENGWVWTNKTPYSETIFKIERLEITPGHSEHVFLNHEGVKSGSGEDLNKWICYKKME
ncbi:C-type lectin domain family 2 member B-like [Lithobates pipiens]